MKKLLFLFIICVVVLLMLTGSSINRLCGIEWISWDEDEKQFFIGGYLMGIYDFSSRLYGLNLSPEVIQVYLDFQLYGINWQLFINAIDDYYISGDLSTPIIQVIENYTGE